MVGKKEERRAFGWVVCCLVGSVSLLGACREGASSIPKAQGKLAPPLAHHTTERRSPTPPAKRASVALPTKRKVIAPPAKREVIDPSAKRRKPMLKQAEHPLPSLPIEKDKMYLVASKAGHKLYVYQGRRMLRAYRVAFGATDEEEKKVKDKEEAGDDRAPLGVFLIDQASPVSNSDFGGYWMRLDTTVKARELYKKKHPKIAARWGRPWGRIKGDQDVREFNRWAKRNRAPLMFRGIGIHGGGWEGSNGCIVLTNEGIKDLYQRLSSSEDGIVGVRVEIRP